MSVFWSGCQRGGKGLANLFFGDAAGRDITETGYLGGLQGLVQHHRFAVLLYRDLTDLAVLPGKQNNQLGLSAG